MSKTVALNSVAFGAPAATEIAPKSPVLILHGLFGSARNWQTFAKKLSEDFAVFTLDLRNHGNSPHIDEMNYPDMALDVIRFLDDNDIQDAKIIGHSMGGKTAMTLALSFPERVQQLVIVDIAPVSYSHNYEALLGNLDQLDLGLIERRADANRMLGEAIDDDELRLFLLQNLVIKAGKPAKWRINLNAIRTNVNHLVQYKPSHTTMQYRGSTAFIRGRLSGYVQDSHLPQITALFPTADFHTIERAGHWPHAQNPTAFLSCIRDLFSCI